MAIRAARGLCVLAQPLVSGLDQNFPHILLASLHASSTCLVTVDSPIEHRPVMPKKTSVSTSTQIDSRRLVRVEPERVREVSSTDYPGHYPDEDHSWDLTKFKKVRNGRSSKIVCEC
jgi:hypothetical protein